MNVSAALTLNSPLAGMLKAASEHPGSILFERLGEDAPVQVSAERFAMEVAALAGRLVSAGVERGDRVAILSRTRYEWALADYAIWSAGAVSVPVYESSSPEQVRWILEDSGAVAVIVEAGKHAEVVGQVMPDSVQTVWVMEAGDLAYREVSPVLLAEVALRQEAVAPGDLATIVYTSGTTGRPKGCLLTHEALSSSVAAATDAMPKMLSPEGRTVMFLPLAHVFARLLQCICVTQRIQVTHCPDPKNLLGEVSRVKPTFLVCPPRVLEKVHAGAKGKAEKAGKGKVFDAAERTAVAWSAARLDGRVPLGLRAKHKVFDVLVYRKLRALMGGDLQSIVSGSAPLGARLVHFFRGAGFSVHEGYGLTETTSCTSINHEGGIKPGSVGRPMNHTEVSIQDGEICVRGKGVFSGYWNSEDTGTGDGWFHTGDLGFLDADGFLTITGRSKEILVTAGGKNVSPGPLEEVVKTSSLVSQAVTVGDRRPFVGMLVTLDEEALAAKGLTIASPEVSEEVVRFVRKANETVSKTEAVKRVRILNGDFSEEAGTLTPTLKVKRSVVMDRYRLDVDALYDSKSPDVLDV